MSITNHQPKYNLVVVLTFFIVLIDCHPFVYLVYIIEIIVYINFVLLKIIDIVYI